ncbi:MAG: YeeE/YedE family protein [Pseudomonadota bacterium]
MMRLFSALAAGLLFGLGLVVSGMTNPAKVLNFLDIAGSWDPSLALVMGGAIAVTLPGFALVQRSERPLFETRFTLPKITRIDRPLIIGSALFGIGWGLVGLCPGPAIAASGLMITPVLIFTGAMLAGMAGYRLITKD